MSWLSALPLVGALIDKCLDRFWPDKSRRLEKILDIELEEARACGGRVTPRMLMKYIVACAFGVYLVVGLLAFFFPSLGPPPDWLRELTAPAGLLFGW